MSGAPVPVLLQENCTMCCVGQAEDWDVETVPELRASGEEEGENPLCGGARPRIQVSTVQYSTV